MVQPWQTKLQGSVRFLSNEYPTWYGTQYNDAYAVYAVTPGGMIMLAQGNLNSSDWSGDGLGFSGGTPAMSASADLSAFAGQAVSLYGLASDVGDTIIDSGVALSGFSLGTIADNIDEMQIPDVTVLAADREALDAPFTFTTETGITTVIPTDNGVLGGQLRIPLRALNAAGETLDLTSPMQVRFDDSNWTSGDLKVTSDKGAFEGGIAYVTLNVSSRLPDTAPVTGQSIQTFGTASLDGGVSFSVDKVSFQGEPCLRMVQTGPGSRINIGPIGIPLSLGLVQRVSQPLGTLGGQNPADLLSKTADSRLAQPFIRLLDAMKFVPKGTPQTFTKTSKLPEGWKFRWEEGATQWTLRYHPPMQGKPSALSSSEWTVRITRVVNGVEEYMTKTDTWLAPGTRGLSKDEFEKATHILLRW